MDTYAPYKDLQNIDSHRRRHHERSKKKKSSKRTSPSRHKSLRKGRSRSRSPTRHHSSKHRSNHRRNRSRSRSHSPHILEQQQGCWACGDKVLEGKLVCASCFSEMSTEPEQPSLDVSDLIKKAVQESMESYISQLPTASTSADLPHTSSSPQDIQMEELHSGFDFSLVQPYAAAVREVLEWESDEESIVDDKKSKKRYYKQDTKVKVTFPYMAEIDEVLKEEWKKLEKKPPLLNRLQKLYPLKEDDCKSLDNPPVTDASVIRLAKHMTLPLEDAISFRDVLLRKTDMDLKKSYVASGAACRPAISLAPVGKAIRSWAENIEEAIKSGDNDSISSALEDLKISGDFVGEAAFDIVRCSSRSMLYAVTAKRALWLKSWSADTNSRLAWCKIPYDGSALFGEKMDSAITRVRGGKSGLIPQDRRPSKPTPSTSQQNRYRNAKTYRPGKSYLRNWQTGQSTGNRNQKQKSTESNATPKKSF